MALGDIGFQSAIDIEYKILQLLDMSVPALGSVGYQSELDILYQIWLRLGGGGGGSAGLLKFGSVTADGSAQTPIPALAAHTIDTDCWIFHTGTKRDTAIEITGMNAGGTITWNAGFEPPLGTRIDFIYY